MNKKIGRLSKVSAAHAKRLEKLGIRTVSDLIFHFPFRYEDYSKITPISEIQEGEIFTVIGELIDVETKRTWKKKMTITEGFVRDGTETVRVVWFNQYYLQNSLKKGQSIRISGKVASDSKGLFFSSPSWEVASKDTVHTGRMVPIYSETNGITSRWIRWQLNMIFEAGFEIEEPLPDEILEKYNLPEIKKALRYLHFPKTEDEYLVAQKRFAFEEMFLVQIKSIQIKNEYKRENAVSFKLDKADEKEFTEKLPFKLTGAQQRSIQEILGDLKKTHPMNRLLNGDVGSGKTVVAATSAYAVSKSKHQTVIMAPTEVLSRQHFESFCELFQDQDINIGLLTNSYKLITWDLQLRAAPDRLFKKTSRENFLEKIKNGELDIIIGTHAVIQKDIEFANLSLVIVDEQHRFGVNQRAYLQQRVTEINDGIEKKIPHFLTMTATPIPRTLSMAFFGNLDISLLDEMPKNRKEIVTQIVTQKDRDSVYSFVKQEIKKGRQAFVILPLIEESKALKELKAAVTEHERLSKNIFPELKLGLIHGKMKSQEKEDIMKDFNDKKYDILVSTSVIEVGIDVPNSTIIIIEDAYRFGLSQLHQFRGRVGRGTHQSYCFLFSKTKTERLRVLERYTDGFKIAKKDLEIRGPGEFFGSRQSGLPDSAMKNITNIKLIKFSHNEAEKLLESDPKLKGHPLLSDALKRFEEKVHLE
ncbi:MAG: ATP-dependent DNA helicase RecG [Candidatus Moranbacteria bacterium]|nr:ATP-dependent DNA helicase RecG [Candidatus Moranbacteria bacterium]